MTEMRAVKEEKIRPQESQNQNNQTADFKTKERRRTLGGQVRKQETRVEARALVQIVGGC